MYIGVAALQSYCTIFHTQMVKEVSFAIMSNVLFNQNYIVLVRNCPFCVCVLK